MAEILRPNFDKLWASAGSVIEPSELKIEMGWMEEVPPSQWENWIQLRQDQAIKYIFQRGIPDWDAKEEYFAGRSAVLLDGDIYIALRNNVNKSPKTNAADWRVVTKDLTIANISGLQAALNNKADKTVSITGVGGLTGGGTLAANRTIDLSAATKNSLTLADGALQKTQNLNDLPNKATARNNLGLGTAATRNVGVASGDIMEVGAFGLGGGGRRNLSGNKDFVSVERSILFSHDATNTPEDAPRRTAATGFISAVGADRSSGIWIPTSSGMSPSIMQRGSDGSVVWTNIFTEVNFNPSTKANTTTQIIAGNGLTGGGNLSANRTLTLGTPSTITKTATNSVSPTSHTHELGADVKVSLALADRALQKSSNLSDVANKATARANLGLGTAATRNVTTSNADVTADRLLKVGDLGSNKRLVEVVDFNALPDLYPYSGAVPVMSTVGSSNMPPKSYYYYVEQHFHVKENVTQIAIPYRVDSEGMWMRSRYDDTWSPWREIYHSGNTHTHPWSQITGAPATATRWPTWGEVSGKPTTFTPSSHTHHWSQIQGAPHIPNVLGATGNSTVDTISQKVISEQLNSRILGDAAPAAGFKGGDVNHPYFRHAPTQDVVDLARTPSQRINLGASGVNNLGRPMIVTFMSSVLSHFSMTVRVDGDVVGRTASPHGNSIGGSVTTVVLAGQSWSADFVDLVTGWIL